MGVALKDLKGKVKRPVRSISVCLDGELWDRHDELTRKLDETRGTDIRKMGDSSEAVAIAEELKQVEAAMREAEVVLRLQGISAYQLKEIQRRFPSEDRNMIWDAEAGAPALLAACMVEPTTEDEALEFLEAVHEGVFQKVVQAAWLATNGSSDVPFSVRASALTRSSEPK